ncbi:FRG domain-containing protein [Acinetobacter junii]|uniref:FRG domain-containing protein n=1 Tax=Acinetobacter junii TaxID=40215 RepID=UPI003A857953
MIENKDFDTVDELMDFISPWGESPKLDGYVFRGHSQESFKLIPSALRPEGVDRFWEQTPSGRPIGNQHELVEFQIHAEYALIREFYRLADRQGLDVPISDSIRANLAQEYDFFTTMPSFGLKKWIPDDLLEAVALAQHYGIPTRLLDWTYDINVALYFAFNGAIDLNGRLVIWAINKEHLCFLKPSTSRINVDFITPHYKRNPNLSAQKGLFTHWQIDRMPMQEQMEIMFSQNGHPPLVDRRPLDELIASNISGEDPINIFKRFTLPCTEARKGCQLLIKMGYGPARLFPGYQGVADQVLNNHRLHS